MRYSWKHPLLKKPWTKYVLATFIFVLWMSFLDSSSWRVHRELDHEIERLEASMDYYRDEINRDQAVIQSLDSSSKALERLAREEYLMHRPNEDVFIFNRD